MYFALDEVGTVVDVNHYGADQLGYTTEELVVQSVLGVFHPEDHDGVRRQLERLLRDTNRVLCWRFRKIRKDGSELWGGGVRPHRGAERRVATRAGGVPRHYRSR